jgi:integrase
MPTFPPLQLRRPPTLIEKRPGQWTLRFRHAGKSRDVLVMGRTDPALQTLSGKAPTRVTDRAARVFTGPYMRGEWSPWEDVPDRGPVGARATVAAAVEAFLARYGDSPETARNYRSVLTRFEATLPPHTFTSEVLPRDVSAFVASVGHTAASRLHAWIHLRAFFSVEIGRGALGTNPVEDVPRPRPDGRILPFAMPDALGAVLAAVRATEPVHLADAVVFALATGLRRGELVAAQAADVDLDAGTVTVRAKTKARNGLDFRPKGRRDRAVQLNPLAVGAAEAALARTDGPHAPLFGPGGTLLSRPRAASTSNLTRAVTRARLVAAERTPGVPSGLNLHALRGHYITYLLLLGWPVPFVQALAGHADAATTLGYWRNAAALTSGPARARFREGAIALGFEPYDG